MSNKNVKDPTKPKVKNYKKQLFQNEGHRERLLASLLSKTINEMIRDSECSELVLNDHVYEKNYIYDLMAELIKQYGVSFKNRVYSKLDKATIEYIKQKAIFKPFTENELNSAARILAALTLGHISTSLPTSAEFQDRNQIILNLLKNQREAN